MNNPYKRQGKDTNKKRLIHFLQSQTKFPEVVKHGLIAKYFGVTNYRSIFRENAIHRIIEATAKEPKTMATLERETGIPQKYICQLKSLLKKRKLIMVAYLGQCPRTLSRGVQFLTSNIISIDSNDFFHEDK